MPFNLRSRSLVKELDLTPTEWRYLVGLAADLKRAKYVGTEAPRLRGRNIVLVFDRTSVPTRCAFETAAYDQGARVTYLGPPGLTVGHAESAEDTARVLGRLYDGIEYCGYTQESLETLTRYAGVPVWNGLTDVWHPTQALCDMLTMREHTAKHDEEIAFAFLGDARSSTGNSVLVAGAMLGMDVRMVAPKELWNRDAVVKEARRVAEVTGARLKHTADVAEGVDGVDYVCTDVWFPGGEVWEAWSDRIALLGPYQVDMDVLRATGNPAVKFMHCLPTSRGRVKAGGELSEHLGIDALEVTHEVFVSAHSIVFDQAENRMHAVKAVMVATLGE